MKKNQCSKRKQKDQCSKKSVKQKCRKTCGLCGKYFDCLTMYLEIVPYKSQSFMNQFYLDDMIFR